MVKKNKNLFDFYSVFSTVYFLIQLRDQNGATFPQNCRQQESLSPCLLLHGVPLSSKIKLIKASSICGRRQRIKHTKNTRWSCLCKQKWFDVCLYILIERKFRDTACSKEKDHCNVWIKLCVVLDTCLKLIDIRLRIFHLCFSLSLLFKMQLFQYQ